MATVKTAISLDVDLFNQAEEAAQDMQLTRSRLIALALKDYLRRWENQRLLESINEAYADGPDEEERAWLRYGRRQMKRILEDE